MMDKVVFNDIILTNAGAVVVCVKVENVPLNLMIDTAATTSMIQRGAVDCSRLKECNRYNTYGIGGMTEANPAYILNLTINDNDYKQEMIEAYMPSLMEMSEYTGTKIDGLLGSDFLIQHNCLLDFNNNYLGV